MLKQEPVDEQNRSEQPQTPRPPSAGAPRVTPEELNAALAAIEARREADAKTIPLDQAVSDLNLGSTPDEIWAEVQAQRAKADAERERQAQRTLPSPVTAAQEVPMRSRRSSRRRLFAPLLFVGGILLLTNHGLIPHFGNSRASHAAPVLRSLAQEPDGKTVYADDAALTQISEGKSSAQITISENASGNRWPIIKQNDHVLLRGYIAQPNDLPSLAGKPLNVYNDDNSGELDGESVSEVTLPINSVPLEKSGGDSDYSEVTVLKFQPNSSTTLNR